MNVSAIRLFLLIMILFGAGCANITAPTGGKKDTIPPKLVSIDPKDSLLNAKPSRIEMNFDEYITVTDASKEVDISPILSIHPTVTGLNKRVVIKIVDSLYEDNTTYRISFGKAIKDLHEGNVFSKYIYTFSTGSYFDSLQLNGSVINAATGMPDTGSVIVELYSAKEIDSAVVRHKPKYITHTDDKGNFSFKGLPGREFRIFALKDPNDNLIYDGPSGNEMIGFNDTTVTPGDSAMAPIMLRMFKEYEDTSIKKNVDTAAAALKKPKAATAIPSYSVGLDTTNASRRTYDINYPINILFKVPPTLNKDRITLSYDSSGIQARVPITMDFDTANPRMLYIRTTWAENTLYTLRLAKSFAKDTAGKDLMPSRYTFRTKEDEDYGKITVQLPKKYLDKKYVLMIVADLDTIYQKPVTDTSIYLTRLKPAKYTFRIIVDRNGNGKWDPGELFKHKQPEEVIPYPDVLTLRAGWENIVEDWDKKPAPKKPDNKNNSTPK